MNTQPNSGEADAQHASGDTPSSEPTGCSAWAPAIIAAASLLLMLFFIVCAGGTYYLFQQRGEFALRTIEGTLIPLIEQSRLEPDDKQASIDELQDLITRGRSGELEDWQIAGAMQRLVRAPVVSWGDLQRIDAVIAQRESFTAEQRTAAHREISRLMRGAELDKVTQFDMASIFEPISEQANHASGYTLNEQFSDEGLHEFIERIRLVAIRAEVPDRVFDVKLSTVVKQQIDTGIQAGMK